MNSMYHKCSSSFAVLHQSGIKALITLRVFMANINTDVDSFIYMYYVFKTASFSLPAQCIFMYFGL